MTDDKTTRRVYSAEELHRLRASCSQPKLREAIEEHDGEDAELVKGKVCHPCSTCIMGKQSVALTTVHCTFLNFPTYIHTHSSGFNSFTSIGIMNSDLSPSFDVHRDWIEQVLNTPASSRQHDLAAPLTSPTSPTEHVLRGSKSFAARSFRSRASGNSLRVPSSNKENRSTNDTENTRSSSSGAHASLLAGPVLGEIAPNGQIMRPIGPWKFRPSPTPSLKKKKAEAIVKAHGSPQHVRVTAGGRIVPSEQSPLCHPRYGYSAVKTNGGLIKFAPNHPIGKAQWTQATQNGFVAQDVNGRLCQIVNGTILPLNEVDGTLRLYVPAPNLSIQSRGSSFGPSAHSGVANNGKPERSTSQSVPPVTADPPIPAQTNALELEYSKLEHELKELDKTEVLHGRTMAKAAKEALVTKRRELIITLDNIRKAIKSIKNAPPPDAPSSPKAMRTQQPASPGRHRLPSFLQQRGQQGDSVAIPPMGAFSHFYGMSQGQHFGGQYRVPPLSSPDVSFNQAYEMPPHALFMPPPSFDGSMAPPFAPYFDSMTNGIAGAEASATDGSGPAQAAAKNESQIPQADGSRSIVDLLKIGSPRQSRAVDIKAPESKQAAAVKSTLNPMSPAYKPGVGVLKATSNGDRPATKSVKDRAPTPLSPLHQLRPSVAANKTSNATDDTSPRKKSPHLHSSSVSSFETADFFPRNTREYSTRKYAYPDHSEDNENIVPLPPSPDHQESRVTPVSSDQGSAPPGCKAPAPPPGTPVTHDGLENKPRLPIQITSIDQSHKLDPSNVPDRQTHNLSPKGRHQDFLFVQEHPSQYGSQASSSPERYQTCREEAANPTSPTEILDFSNESTDWIEGYRAGLARKPVGSDRIGDFLDGYCAGLLKSKPVSNIGPSTGSPVKSASRRPSPAIAPSRSSSRLNNIDRQDHAPTRPPLETSVQSMDTLKEAVMAPHNEDAILTPTADGPHVNEPHFNLGAWEKHHELQMSTSDMTNARGDGLAGFPFPHRTASMLQRQGITSEPHATSVPTGHNSNIGSKASTFSSLPGFQTMAPFASDARSINSSTAYNPGNRISSMTSIDSHLYRQYPGHRVFSPHLEWKSASSVAQAAGLASGFFHNTQYDGASHHLRKHISNPDSQANRNVLPGAGPLHAQASTTHNAAMETHSRFKEGSLDGVTNPPTSPEPLSPPMSPSIAPKGSPGKEAKKKGASPAKATFENLAEKVGIKVAGGKKEEGSSPNSPPGKRRWMGVWRAGANRKEVGKEEEAKGPMLW